VTTKEDPKVKFDIALPKLKLALEYHGKQHYNDYFEFGATSPSYQRLQFKQRILESGGYTLIQVRLVRKNYESDQFLQNFDTDPLLVG